MNPGHRPAGPAPALAVAALRLGLLFAVVFYGADAFTAWRGAQWALYARWELAIPYWPPAWAVYFSVFLLPFGLLWQSGGAAQVRRWERRMALAVLVAGLCFVLLPARLGFAPLPAPDGAGWQVWAQTLAETVARTVAGRHNLLPSLHVALSLVTVLALWPGVPALARAGLVVWFVALAGSVLLTHQHHLADLVSGAALGGWLGRGLATTTRPG